MKKEAFGNLGIVSAVITIGLLKVKVKVDLWGFSTLRPFGLLYSYPQQVPSFIPRGATHHTDARDLYQRRREPLPMNLASRSVIYENPLGSFTCRKAGTYHFTSPLKEGILRIFRTPEKSNGFGSQALSEDYAISEFNFILKIMKELCVMLAGIAQSV